MMTDQDFTEFVEDMMNADITLRRCADLRGLVVFRARMARKWG